MNSNTEEQNGCEVQVHEVSETFGLDPAKEKKITDRIIAHQLIILETTGNKYIDKIMIREFNKDKLDEKQSTIKISEGNSQPTSLVRPSSLNYKISLSEAVNDFIKKDMPTTDEQFIDVVLEEPKVLQNSSNHTTGGKGNNNNNNNNNEHDDFDDVMFDMTAPNVSRTTNTKGKGGQPQTPATQQNH